MNTAKRIGVTLGAAAALLALGALPSIAADEAAAPATSVEPPRVAAAAAPAARLPVLPVVGGATALTEQAKADVDGGLMKCARMTFITIYYVFGIEVYRTSEERWVCDPSIN